MTFSLHKSHNYIYIVSSLDKIYSLLKYLKYFPKERVHIFVEISHKKVTKAIDVNHKITNILSLSWTGIKVTLF